MKSVVILVIIGATGIVTKGVKQYLEIIPGKNSVDSLQKNSFTRDIAHNKEAATVSNLKTEWWAAPLVQGEKCQGKGNL
jgi:hypothetical protein